MMPEKGKRGFFSTADYSGYDYPERRGTGSERGYGSDGK